MQVTAVRPTTVTGGTPVQRQAEAKAPQAQPGFTKDGFSSQIASIRRTGAATAIVGGLVGAALLAVPAARNATAQTIARRAIYGALAGTVVSLQARAAVDGNAAFSGCIGTGAIWGLAAVTAGKQFLNMPHVAGGGWTGMFLGALSGALVGSVAHRFSHPQEAAR